MKNAIVLFLSLFVLYSCHLGKDLPSKDNDVLSGNTTLQDEFDIEKALSQIEGLEFEKIAHDSIHFNVAYKVFIQQPLDHFDHSKGYFTQKFYLSHINSESPMIMNINGYSVPSNAFVSELVPWLGANFMHVEHRFFGESIPDNMDYSTLTIEQAANDHHRIIETLKKIYPGKWITTGISKGGQCTIFHSNYFPNDADISIPYVAPVNLAQEDERLITFLDEVGSKACRDNILEYQRAVLSNYDEGLNLFASKAQQKNISFPMKVEKAFELSVLEYEFAYWQWSGGDNCDALPGKDDDLETLIEELFKIDSPGFFTKSSIEYFFPFFYQAYAELGMYGYAVDSLDGYLKEYEDYVNNYYTFIPEGFTLVYDPDPLKEVYEYLVEDADNFIFVYGENDAWSATAFIPNSNKTNSITMIKKGGSHFTRINDLSVEQQNIVFSKLEEWLDVKVVR